MANEIETTGEQSQENQKRIAEELDRILRSTRFRNRAQMQSLLRYVVDEAMKGKEGGLKERIIGIYVFGRRPDYDMTEDPIVRSRMGLLRKRLAHYYESDVGEEAFVQIVIPNGTYRPVFVFRSLPGRDCPEAETKVELAETKTIAPSGPVVTGSFAALDVPAQTVSLPGATSAAPPEPYKRWRHRGLVAVAAVVFCLVATWWFFLRPQQSEIDALWAPIIKGKQTIYIYTGTMPVYEPGSSADKTTPPVEIYSPIQLPEPPNEDASKTEPTNVSSWGEGMLTGSAYADSRVSAFLSRYNRTPVSRTGPNLPYQDLKGSPLILIGSFDNYWMRMMNDSLPFYLDGGAGIRERDGAHRGWHNPLRAEMTPRMMDDYALIFRIMDSKAGAPVLAIAGLSTCGTHAAADFVTDPVQMHALLDIPRTALRSKNIELVLHTSLVNCAPAAVEVVASKIW